MKIIVYQNFRIDLYKIWLKDHIEYFICKNYNIAIINCYSKELIYYKIKELLEISLT